MGKKKLNMAMVSNNTGEYTVLFFWSNILKILMLIINAHLKNQVMKYLSTIYVLLLIIVFSKASPNHKYQIIINFIFFNN